MKTNQRLFDTKTGNEILPGTIRETFRGETVEFSYISKENNGHSTGRIVVKEGEYEREYYPNVIGACIRYPMHPKQ
jgi:hypothetical protein